jgi:hypothetical protein
LKFYSDGSFTLLYGCETWIKENKSGGRIEAAGIEGIRSTRLDKIKN